MLFKVIKRLIAKGQTEGLQQKIDIFFATEKLTESEYNKLCDLLKKGA